MRRVVGILTQAVEWQRQLQENPERQGLDTSGAVGEMLREVIHGSVQVPHDATPQQIATAVMSKVEPVIIQLVGAFSVAFAELAACHDNGHVDVPSIDVLREIALRAGRLDED